MSDQLDGKVVQFPGAGQHQAASPDGAGAQTTKPEYLTRIEAEQLAKDAAEDAFRRAQSLYDKGNEKVRAKLAEVESFVTRSKAIGLELSEQQVERLRQDAMTSAWTEQPNTNQNDPPSQQPAQAGGGGQDEELDPINAEAIRMMQDAGIELLDNDPEVEKFLNGVNEMTPYQYLQAVQQAINEKQNRINRPPQARMPGLGAGGAAGGDLQAQYQAELARIPRGRAGDVARGELKARYRQKGLPVY